MLIQTAADQAVSCYWEKDCTAQMYLQALCVRTTSDMREDSSVTEPVYNVPANN